MTHTIHHFINGKIAEGTGQSFSPVYDPSTRTEIAKVAHAAPDDVENAVASAKAAYESWSNWTPLNRARVMYRFKALLEEDAQSIAELISKEHGKVIDDAMGEVTRCLEVVEFACGAPHLLKGDVTENVGTRVDSHSLRQPLGVVAGITPFNFPLMVPGWMFPVALVCGNTFILKPSEKDPSASLRIAELLKQAGLPDGVFNVIQGDKTAVDALIKHPDVHAISFVGSTPIASYIYTTGAAHGKRVQALGGAKNHMVIMPDADIEQASQALMGAAYGAAGERCMAISVAVAVTDAVADKLVASLKDKIAQLNVGPYSDPDSQMGPLISEAHRDNVVRYIEMGVEEGAELVVDGRQHKIDSVDHQNGYFLGASLFDRVSERMTIHSEEIFGPVLCIVRARNYSEAVGIINRHKYGNGTSIFTRDGDTARAFGNEIQVGMVGINVPIPVPMAFHSFGGWKQSLFGDHHIHGSEGVRFYTKLKTITSRWPTGQRLDPDFVMPTMK
ncbi:CoA-acylating methylmalonate-semialdehyde dehydrogenase [Porticoccus sp. W117]|uniref:CoA-acylating methylmalonate-semialdehyde dehydrogenase n=1 Tax=Porticoccus sp. W117 TaxID=3054777 RepID=UPI002592A1F6|nr:CoA-acylating methylmalonate-semialdehyde dehydrogenase [Porticoccus sp. W117]MDM3870091.1 CoA-acylating methylmalonate-semialdehyde dehydrogenase [Porticoccus sp. W117]